jgi:hypothetical protein
MKLVKIVFSGLSAIVWEGCSSPKWNSSLDELVAEGRQVSRLSSSEILLRGDKGFDSKTASSEELTSGVDLKWSSVPPCLRMMVELS